MNSSFTHFTGARQTMMSWARLIESCAAVPAPYQDAYQKLVGNASPLPYAVLAPAQNTPRSRKSTEKLLCEIGDAFYVLDRAGAQVITTGYRYQDISSLEVGNIILYSWFSIYGTTITGAKAGLTVAFNEATRRHFEPFFAKMRPTYTRPYQVDRATEQEKFNGLSRENYKYMNLARQNLAPGARVVQMLYQPSNRQRVMSVLGRHFYRTNFLAHLTILTDAEIILIGEAERVTEKERSPYGGVLRYLPLRNLNSVDIDERPDGIVQGTFRLAPDIRVERLFAATHLPELVNLKMALEALH